MCTGGDSTTEDTCKSIIGPEAELTNIDSKTYIATIAFTERVFLSTLGPNDITVEITGPYAPYEFDFVIDQTTGYIENTQLGKFGILLDFKSSLIGNNEGKNQIMNFRNCYSEIQ